METLVRFSDTDESILDTKTVVDYNDGALSQYEVPVVYQYSHLKNPTYGF